MKYFHEDIYAITSYSLFTRFYFSTLMTDNQLYSTQAWKLTYTGDTTALYTQVHLYCPFEAHIHPQYGCLHQAN